MDADEAASIALTALEFLAEDIQRLGRFLALTGLGPGELRQEARSPRVLGAVLDHLAHDESLLLAFAVTRRLDPKLIREAQSVMESHDESGHS